VGGDDTGHAAELLVALGLLASVPTAAAGLSDWADTQDGERRVGLVHAASNVAALMLYAASLVARRRERRGFGVLLALAGGGVTTVGAYLGGHLSLSQAVGVDHAAFEHAAEDWTEVLESSEVSEGTTKLVTVDGVTVMVTRRRGRAFALSSRCSHLGGPLQDGAIDDATVTCPWHGSRFRLADGAVVSGPARAPQPAYDVRERDHKIEIRLQAPRG
jgi:nitrite reductase/ring-hydroxylating ferredoxin subunit